MSEGRRSVSFRPALLAVSVTAVAVVASCVSAAPTTSPSDASASPSAVASASAAAPAVPSSSAPALSPAPDPSQTPRQSPSPTGGPVTTGGRWTASGDLVVPRVSTHAFALPDGRVLAVGNDSVGAWVRSDSNATDLGDVQSSHWAAGAKTGKPRAQSAAARLADGRVLVTGGISQTNAQDCWGSASFSSTVIYDPRTGAWTASGLLNQARTAPSAATLADGRVLVAGGFFFVPPPPGWGAAPAVFAAYRPGDCDREPVTLADVPGPPIGGALATAEIYDAAGGRWTTTGPMRYARFGPAMVTLKDGSVLVVGSLGGNDGGVALDTRAFETAELYDPATGRFTLTGSLPRPDVTALKALGVEFAIDPASGVGDGSVTSVGTLVALDDGGALLVGATRSWKHTAELSRSFRYDAKSDRWTEIGRPYAKVRTDAGWAITPTVSRGGAYAAKLADGRVLIAGGDGTGVEGGGVVTASAEIYDPGSNAWTNVSSLPSPRAGGTALRLADGSVLLVGGYAASEDQWGSCDQPVGLAATIRFVP